MDSQPSTAGKIFAAVVAAVAWCGLIIQFYVTMTHPNLANISPVSRGVLFFDFFTILTNLLVAVSLTVSLLASTSAPGRFLSRTTVKTAVAVYIALVGIIFNIVLQGLHTFEGAAFVADAITHDVVPLVYVLYWFIFVPKGELGWKAPLWWPIYPLVYVPYVLIRGVYTGRYPYPFLDVGELGYFVVFVNTVILTGVFLVLGEIFVAADKAVARLTQK